MIGYTVAPFSPSNERILIDAAGSWNYGIQYTGGSTSVFYVLANLDLYRHISTSAYFIGKNNIVHLDCCYRGTTGYGANAGSNHQFYNCDMYSHGWRCLNVSGQTVVRGGEYHDTTSNQIMLIGGVSTVSGVTIYGIPSGQTGLYFSYGPAWVDHVTIDGQNVANTTGIYMNDNADYLSVTNSIVYDCKTPIEASHALSGTHWGGWNCYNSNSNDNVNYPAISAKHLYAPNNNINSDPLFVDAANHDYRLKFGSPCRGADNSGTGDIGALQRREMPMPPMVSGIGV